MGSSLSSVLCDVAMTYIIQHVLSNIQMEPKVTTKYVDDLFFVIPSTQVDILLNGLNSFHPDVKFTREVEQNGQLPYLDVMLIRNDSTRHIDTKIYQKPTSKGRILNFHSSHSFSLKKNTATGLINRTYKLTSPHLWCEVERKLKQDLFRNSYPNKLVKEWIQFSKNNMNNPVHNNIQSVNQQQHVYKSLTYVSNLTEKIIGTFKRLCPEVKCATKSSNTIGQKLFSRIKDKLNKGDQSGVVYSIPCNNCNMKYIGQTKNKLKDRLRTHAYDVTKITDVNNAKTALATHSFLLNHTFDFDRATTIDHEKNLGKRLFKEMVHIKLNEKTTVNKRTDIENLSTIYSSILK